MTTTDFILAENEQVLFTDTPSRFLFLLNMTMLVLLTLLSLFMVAPLTGLLALVTWLRYKRSALTLTNKRVHIKRGKVFGTSVEEIPLGKIETVGLEVGILGQQLSGKVKISGAGNWCETLQGYNQPVALRQAITEQL